MGTLSEDTRWLDATAQAELVANGDVSALELTEAAIERIERLDGPINAVILRWFDHAREVAAGDDLPEGPFRGVPFLLKDLWAPYAGQPMTNGNVALRDAMPISPVDSTLVSRFRAAGLVTLGRTNSPELGSLPVTEPVAYGPTRNPWNTDHVPGGSSGGAAAAVAAGMVPIAHASDGGGSIRIPASCCGLVGLKPSQGRITLGPLQNRVGTQRSAVRQQIGARHGAVARCGARTGRRRHGDRPAARPVPMSTSSGPTPAGSGSGCSMSIPAGRHCTPTVSMRSARQRRCSNRSVTMCLPAIRLRCRMRRSPSASWRSGVPTWRSESMPTARRWVANSPSTRSRSSTGRKPGSPTR